MRLPGSHRIAVVALLGLSLAGLASAVAAANTVVPSRAGMATLPITPGSLAPAECSAVITVTRLVLGSGKFNGTNSSELILGSGGSDDINGGGGADCILGGGGDDLVTGGSGTDVLIGGPGDDRLRGGGGDDWLYGGRGIDDLDGSGGTDSCFGGGDVGDTFSRCEVSGP